MTSTFDNETPTPCTYPGCDRILKGNSGLGGHLAWHNRQDTLAADSKAKAIAARTQGAQKRKPRRLAPDGSIRPERKPKKQIAAVDVLDAMTICSTVLEAMFPSGLIPLNKVPVMARWAAATERFVEDIYGDH